MTTTAVADSTTALARSTGQSTAMSLLRDAGEKKFWALHMRWEKERSAEAWRAMMAQGVFDKYSVAAKLIALGNGREVSVARWRTMMTQDVFDNGSPVARSKRGQMIVAAGFTAIDVLRFDIERCRKMELVH